MKIFKILLSVLLTVALIYFTNNQVSIGTTKTPPPGKFLSPFHGFLQNSENKNIPFEAKPKIPGLKEEVQIIYDKNLVPHIYAKNEEDLYLAQGYVVAQLRLWQLEFQTHAAAGRISEILGYSEGVLEYDRLQRRKGLPLSATKAHEAMLSDSKTKMAMEAYAKGVNAYIDQLSPSKLPIEYKLLDYTPETWTTEKTALILAYMIESLTGWDGDLENTLTRAAIGEENYAILFPDYPEGVVPTIPTDSAWTFTPSSIIAPKVKNIPNIDLQNFMQKPDPDNGSNNWAISPQKSSTGNAILANDTHLNLNMPSLWVLMHLHAPGINTYGYTFTGAPGITIGFNENIAWGFTNAPRDTRDWYTIQFKDKNKDEYWYNNGWTESKKSIETIAIKGHPTYYDTIVYTHHGPVVYQEGILGNNKQHNLALRWTGHEPSLTLKAIYLLNRASSYTTYKEAIAYWDSPPQNIVFASTQGDIALTVQGKYPNKWKEQGKFIMAGSDPAMEWQGFIPKAHAPSQVNPKRQFVSSANQHSVAPDYPYYYYNGRTEFYRNRRINQLLETDRKLGVSDMQKMQNDVYNLKAAEVLPLVLDSVNLQDLSNENEEIVALLTQWDYEFNAKDKAPVVFQMFWQHLYSLTWDELDTLSYRAQKPAHYNTFLLYKNEPNNQFFDILGTDKKETFKDLIAIALDSTAAEYDKFKRDNSDQNTGWGTYKDTRIAHLTRLDAFTEYLPTLPGHADAINSTKWSHGPSQRLIVEMSSPPKGYGVLPGGLSGNPGSYYYNNLIKEYTEGTYITLDITLTPSNFSENSVFNQTLTPTK